MGKSQIFSAGRRATGSLGLEIGERVEHDRPVSELPVTASRNSHAASTQLC